MSAAVMSSAAKIAKQSPEAPKRGEENQVVSQADDLPESVLRTMAFAGATLFGKSPFDDENFGQKTSDGFPYDGWCPKCEELYPTINGREECLRCHPCSY